MTNADIDELGPVDYLVVEFPPGRSHFTGEMAAEIGRLVDAKLIRVLDLLIVQKAADGIAVAAGQRRRWYDASGIANCAAAGDCDTVTSAFTTHYSWLQTLLGNVLIDFFPAVIGVFWGAPLIARELDTGSYRLVWTQSVTRTRWLAAKITIVGAASIAASM